jgi:transposase
MPSRTGSVAGQPSYAVWSAEQARPLVGALKTWLEAELIRLSPRSGLADAIRYALVRWDALCR